MTKDIVIQNENGVRFAIDKGGPNWAKVAAEWRIACEKSDATVVELENSRAHWIESCKQQVRRIVALEAELANWKAYARHERSLGAEGPMIELNDCRQELAALKTQFEEHGGRVDDMTEERDSALHNLSIVTERCRKAEAELATLKALQEPIGYFINLGGNLFQVADCSGDYTGLIPLYARPVPAPAVPEVWKPINTAPKDVPVIGALIKNNKVWRVFDMRWHSPVGWYDQNGTAIPQPTHWMPLAAAPEYKGEKE